MSYQVLARKWRPADFSEVAGQVHVLKSLSNALDNERLHHAYLFTGTRGVGKTTLARILAKCLNCEKGVGSAPCGACGACREIGEGRFIDLIEVDAASRTKVEDTRELLENAQYTPTRGRFKVYLIDEVHMLSINSFNALLKTLEEPPPHVKFLLATTDPRKIPVTVLSRCLQFNLKNLSPELIVEHLRKVLNEEKVRYDGDALWQIAMAAAGSMRDALTLADQAIAYCQGEIGAAGVIEMLGVPEHRQVFSLLEALASGDAAKLLELTGLIAEGAPDYAHTLNGLLSLLHRVALEQCVPGAVDNSFGDREQVKELAARLTAEDVHLFYDIGAKGREDLKLGVDVRTTFEMLMMRMMVFSPDFDRPAPARAEAAPEGDAAAPPPGEAARPGPKADSAPDAAAPPAAREGGPRTTRDEGRPEHPPPREPAGSPPERTGAVEDAARGAPEAAAGREAEDGRALALDHAGWMSLVADQDAAGMAENVLANTVLDRVEDGKLFLRLDPSRAGGYTGDGMLPRLSEVASGWLGRKVGVSIEIGEAAEDTPARLKGRKRDALRRELVDGFENDPKVMELVKKFSGRINRDTIQPAG